MTGGTFTVNVTAAAPLATPDAAADPTGYSCQPGENYEGETTCCEPQ